jgi:hypothetical protein
LLRTPQAREQFAQSLARDVGITEKRAHGGHDIRCGQAARVGFEGQSSIERESERARNAGLLGRTAKDGVARHTKTKKFTKE